MDNQGPVLVTQVDGRLNPKERYLPPNVISQDGEWGQREVNGKDINTVFFKDPNSGTLESIGHYYARQIHEISMVLDQTFAARIEFPLDLSTILTLVIFAGGMANTHEIVEAYKSQAIGAGTGILEFNISGDPQEDRIQRYLAIIGMQGLNESPASYWKKFLSAAKDIIKYLKDLNKITPKNPKHSELVLYYQLKQTNSMTASMIRLILSILNSFVPAQRNSKQHFVNFDIDTLADIIDTAIDRFVRELEA